MPDPTEPAARLQDMLKAIEDELANKSEIVEVLVGRAQSDPGYTPDELRAADELLRSVQRIQAMLDGWHIARGETRFVPGTGCGPDEPVTDDPRQLCAFCRERDGVGTLVHGDGGSWACLECGDRYVQEDPQRAHWAGDETR